MSLLFFVLILLGNTVEYTDTAVVQPLLPEEVRVDYQGNVYILAFPLGMITIYDSEGRIKNQIGGKGDGPGELTYPINFWVSEKHIYVFDMKNTTVSQFELQGKFIKRWPAPSRNLILVRVKDGWFYGTWGSFGLPNSSRDIHWSDNEFKTTRVVGRVKDLGFSEGLKTFSTDREHKGIYNPIENRPIMLASRDGEQVFISDTINLKIQVFSASEKKLVRTIQHPVQRIPFDDQWADEKFLTLADKRMRSAYKWKKEYPQYFPAIRRMVLSEEGNLLIDRWRGKPDDNINILALTPTGKKVDGNWSLQYLTRFICALKDYVYVTTWDAESAEAGVIRLPRHEFKAFLEGTQIPTDEYNGRSISY